MSIDGLRFTQMRHLTARCTITRGTYPNQADVATGVPCNVRPSGGRANRQVDVAGGETAILPMYEVRLPADQDIARHDVITFTTSRDPQFTGRYLRVVEVLVDEFVATRLVVCQETL